MSQPEKIKPLDFNAVAQIAGALGRLKELAELAIQTKAHEAEIRGLHEYLANTFLNHGEEFLGCWFTVRREYEPMLRSLSTVAYRIQAIMSKVVPLAAAPEAPTAPAQSSDTGDDAEKAAAGDSSGAGEPANVIKLGQLPRA